MDQNEERDDWNLNDYYVAIQEEFGMEEDGLVLRKALRLKKNKNTVEYVNEMIELLSKVEMEQIYKVKIILNGLDENII